MGKNILLINHYAGTPEMGMEFRPYYFAKEWVKNGYRVDIIAADYSHLRIKNPNIAKDFEEEIIDGIHYHWVHTLSYKGNGAKRALTMFQFVGKLWLNAKKIAKNFKPDVIITSSTYPLDTYAGQRIRRYRRGSKLIHEVHDMWPITPIELYGMSKYNPFVVLMQIGENSFCKKADEVVSILPKCDMYLAAHGMKLEKFHYIPNGINIDEWEKAIPLPQVHQTILDNAHSQGRMIFTFFGSHTKSYSLDYLLDAISICDQTKVFVCFVGNGNFKLQLQMKAEQLGLSKDCYVFLDSIEKRAIPSLLNATDVSYVGAIRNRMFRFGIGMNKLFDAMMGGKPILYAVDAPNNMIEQYSCGISVEAENTQELANGIKQFLLMDEMTRKEMGERAKTAIMECYIYEVLAQKFVGVFDN